MLLPVIMVVSTVVVYTLHIVHRALGGQKKWFPPGLFSSLAGWAGVELMTPSNELNQI